LVDQKFAYAPLQNRVVLITRTEEGNAIEKEKIEAKGGRVINLPLLEVKSPSDPGPIDVAISYISKFDWIVFTSSNGVKEFFDRISKNLETNRREEIRARFACVGPGTAKTLEGYGFKTALIPDEFLTEKLGRKLGTEFDLREKKILLARAEGANPALDNALHSAGAEVLSAAVYKTVPRKINRDSGPDVPELVSDITLTSPSAVSALVSNFEPAEITSRKIKIHCIGPVTAQKAMESGLEVTTVSSVHTIDGLIDSMVRG
jgi:uroporphyrinogen-III synthase